MQGNGPQAKYTDYLPVDLELRTDCIGIRMGDAINMEGPLEQEKKNPYPALFIPSRTHQ